jgi:hypothetical protein
MPKGFRVVVALSCPLLLFISDYTEPGRGFVGGVIIALLWIAAGVSTVLVGLNDRKVSGVDDPTTLNLHR